MTITWNNIPTKYTLHTIQQILEVLEEPQKAQFRASTMLVVMILYLLPWNIALAHLIQKVVVHMRIPPFQLGKLSPKLQQLISLRSPVENGIGVFALKQVLQIMPHVLLTCTVSCLRKYGCHPFLGARVFVRYKDQTVWFADLSYVRNQLHNSSLSKFKMPYVMG